MDEADLPPDQGPMPRLSATPAEARITPIEPGHLSALMMQYGSMQLRWYAPVDQDHQVPHDRDELYVVVSGTAVFVRATEAVPFGETEALGMENPERVAVAPGDALFVPAGTEHRFEDMSEGFATWMIFYGPEGGEGSLAPLEVPASLLEDPADQ